LGRGQVVTWLPDGRWVTHADGPEPDVEARRAGRYDAPDDERHQSAGSVERTGREPVQPDFEPGEQGQRRSGHDRPEHGRSGRRDRPEQSRSWRGRPEQSQRSGRDRPEQSRSWRGQPEQIQRSGRDRPEQSRSWRHRPEQSQRSSGGRPEQGQRRDEPAELARRWGRRRVRLARIGARLAGWPRRLLIGVLLVAAAVLALRPDDPPAPAATVGATQHVVVAARDLAAGTELGAADLRIVSMPVGIVPSGSSPRAAGLIGRIAAGAIRRGEALTDARVVGPGLTAGLDPGESAAVPVRIADPEAAALVRVGDRVDVLGTPVAPDGSQATAGETVTIASAVRVLAVLRSRDPADGVVLVVAIGAAAARTLAGAAGRHRLTVNLRPP
jgi:pilus assembly protein CpaB